MAEVKVRLATNIIFTTSVVSLLTWVQFCYKMWGGSLM